MNALLNGLKLSGKVVVGAGVTALGGYTAYRSVRTVPPSHRSYSSLFGDVGEEPLDSGIHIINPAADLVTMSLLTTNYQSDIKINTKEGLDIGVGVNAIYKINPENSRDVYLKYRHNYEQVLIRPLIRSTLRKVMTKYEAKDLYSDDARSEIKKNFNNIVIDKLAESGIIVDDLFISNIILPEKLSDSIKDKLRAEQTKEKMKFEIEQQKLEAEKMRIEAEGIKTADNILKTGLTKELIQLKAIQATRELAKSENSKVVVIGNKDTSGMPLILGNV